MTSKASGLCLGVRAAHQQLAGGRAHNSRPAQPSPSPLPADRVRRKLHYFCPDTSPCTKFRPARTTRRISPCHLHSLTKDSRGSWSASPVDPSRRWLTGLTFDLRPVWLLHLVDLSFINKPSSSSSAETLHPSAHGHSATCLLRSHPRACTWATCPEMVSRIPDSASLLATSAYKRTSGTDQREDAAQDLYKPKLGVTEE